MFFGVGNKNYRVATCTELDETNILTNKYVCSTHPHQIYIELLSEHGLFGSIFILFIFYKLIFSKFICNFHMVCFKNISRPYTIRKNSQILYF